MPKIKKVSLPSSVEVEVTLREFLDSCNSAEKSELFRTLYNSGYAFYSGIDRNVGRKRGPRGGKKAPDKSIPHQEFSSACYALARNYHQVSRQEEDAVKEAARRFLP